MKSASSLRPLPLLLLLVTVATSPPLRAQSSDVDRARLFRSQATVQAPPDVSSSGVDQGYAAASPNDADLGEQAILKRVEKYEPFTFETGMPM